MVTLGAVLVFAAGACGSPSPVAPSATPSPGNPLAGMRFYVDPHSEAAHQVEAWRRSRPSDADQMVKIAREPQADWLGDWIPDVRSWVAERAATAAAAGTVPLFVTYNHPQRDCGLFSAGGAPDTASYRTWIREVAAGIGGSRAVVIVEVDALALLDLCLGTSAQQERVALVRDAVAVLQALPAVTAYVDAGNSATVPADVIAARLRDAGGEAADGFALNVSDFQLTANEIAYGRAIAARLSGRHFVIDTSRNGLGPGFDWCNPPGRGLGARPTTETADPQVDALLWIKRPGESDGECRGGPRAGAWWPDYALGLARRSVP